MKITDKHGREWVVVPVEATAEMLKAGAMDWRHAKRVYDDMLAAAPAFEAPEVTDEMAFRVRLAMNHFPHLSTERAMVAAVQQVLGRMRRRRHGRGEK